MRPPLIILAILMPLAGCASEEPAAARDPYEECRQQGLPVDSHALQSCVDRAIDTQCAEPTGGLERQLCARRLRDQVLISRELERRSSRPGFDQLLGN